VTSNEVLLHAQDLRARRTPFVMATVVRAQRPTSAKAGDCALVLPDGTLDGFVGGACAESTVRLQGLRLLQTGESTLLRISPDADESAPPAEGMVTVTNECLSGGTLDIFLEAMLPPTLVYVFGDGPVAQAMVRVGAAIGYDIVTTSDPQAPIPADASAVLVASHGRDEEPVLTAAVRANVPYIALIASRRRGGAVLGGLDLTDGQRALVRTPAGLDIGARGPAEVALSVLAEIISLRPQPTGPVRQQPATAVDPVCGMDVAVTPDATSAEHGGRTWYFCAPGCRRAFLEQPERYG
jgi:xanthine dehydrogenase accessory factor